MLKEALKKARERSLL